MPTMIAHGRARVNGYGARSRTFILQPQQGGRPQMRLATSHRNLPLLYSISVSYPRPASLARMMAWARSATCSLVKMFET